MSWTSFERLMYVQFMYGVNNPVNNIHERASRIVFGDYRLTFQQLLKQSKSVLYIKVLQILATEIFKTKNGLNPVIMKDIFKFKNLTHNF